MKALRQAGVPWWPLAALTAAVLALHLLVLGATPGAIALHKPGGPASFMTRTVESPRAAPLPAPVMPVAAPALPKPPVIKEKPPQARAKPSPDAIISIAESPPSSTTAAPAANAPAEPAPAPAAAAPQEAPRERLQQASAFAVPGSVRLRYQVSAFTRGMDLKAKGELLWRQDGQNYEARLELALPFLPARVQHSSGRITAAGLEPIRFSDRTRKEEAAHFERDRGRLSFSNNRPEAPLLAGAQDRLSVLLQLGAMIAGEPSRYPPATTIQIQTASAREAEVWLFTVEGEEELSLPGGRLQALKLIRNPRKEFDQQVEVWLAPGMDYMPARVRLTQANGDVLDQQWLATDRP